MKNMMLDKCKRGQFVRITLISDIDVKIKAIRFGISEGEIVQLNEIIPAGPVVIRKNNQEIAIGRGLAGRIEVELVS
jgi:Fe2+ transport system protein FeoA